LISGRLVVFGHLARIVKYHYRCGCFAHLVTLEKFKPIGTRSSVSDSPREKIPNAQQPRMKTGDQRFVQEWKSPRLYGKQDDLIGGLPLFFTRPGIILPTLQREPRFAHALAGSPLEEAPVWVVPPPERWKILGTTSSGEFGWGGTSVRRQHRCPEV